MKCATNGRVKTRKRNEDKMKTGKNAYKKQGVLPLNKTKKWLVVSDY